MIRRQDNKTVNEKTKKEIQQGNKHFHLQSFLISFAFPLLKRINCQFSKPDDWQENRKDKISILGTPK